MCKTVILPFVWYGYETFLHAETGQIENVEGQSKGKEIPVQTWAGPEGIWRWEDCQLFAPVAFTPQEILLLEADNHRAIMQSEGLRQ